jgi:glyoxylase-like metal-dependent hydrolase (beta-lactamase superfamily II)/rhodanese-related sulfurtransferase
MSIIPFVHQGLGNSSYLVELPDGEAALVDPDRTVERYLRAAEARGRRISAVLETHLHADFVSGALELARAAGARVFASQDAALRFPHHPVRPGARVRIGGAEFEAIASPGHTPEHVSYVLRSERRPPALFSGGALIVGGVARTDLISPEQTELLTRASFRTLRSAFAALPDETELLPTHGGGSFCSAGAGGERTSTLGRERAANPMLAIDDEEAFVRWLPATFPAVPTYYSRMRPINQRGPRLRASIAPPPALPPETFAEGDGLVLDVRDVDQHAAGHVPGALNIAFRPSFAVWLGWLVPEDMPLRLVLGEEPLGRVLDEAFLVGYERFAGWLEGGMEAWRRVGLPVSESKAVGAAEARRLAREGAAFIDVREPDEVAAGKIEGALEIPLGDLAARAAELPDDGRPVVVYCSHGERAASGVSILERAGLRDVGNLDGGFEAWRAAGQPLATG